MINLLDCTEGLNQNPIPAPATATLLVTLLFVFVIKYVAGSCA